jgi:hypothetical protein
MQHNSGTWYWSVNFSRNGKAHCDQFSDLAYGSAAKARAAAVAWRDEQLKTAKPLTLVEFCQKKRSNNTSGVPGVCLMFSARQPLGFWQAKLTIGGGKYKSKSFSVLTHGNEGAYKLAVAARQQLLSDAKDVPYLYDPLAKKLARYNGIQADPERHITVSAGATGSFHCACAALLNPGDEVILFEPYYQYHATALKSVDTVPVSVRMQPPDWIFSLAEVERAVTNRTRAIVVNSPGNPSGKVFSRAELEGIAAIATRHDLFVFTDEIYEYILYDGARHVSMATLPGMALVTVPVTTVALVNPAIVTTPNRSCRYCHFTP